MMTENKKNTLNLMVEAATKGSEAMAEDFTSWRKPMVRAVYYFLTFLIMLFALPFIIPFKLFRNKLIDPYSKMQTNLETTWKTESSEKALMELRDIHQKLSTGFKEVMLKGLQIEPYGKFKFFEYVKVCYLLYHWELQHQNWENAGSVCDDLLEKFGDIDPHKSKTHAEWITYKAKIVDRLEGNFSAQEYLLKYIDPEKRENLINEYLYELRKTSD